MINVHYIFKYKKIKNPKNQKIQKPKKTLVKHEFLIW